MSAGRGCGRYIAEELRTSGGIALAGFIHALANERPEIATFGHDEVLSVTPVAACPPARVHQSEWTTKLSRSGGAVPPLLRVSDPGAVGRWELGDGSNASSRLLRP
jgi:hypothetical protein